MRLLYSLLFIFLTISSLFSSPESECPDLHAPYIETFFNHTSNDCLNKGYYPKGVFYSCGSSSITRNTRDWGTKCDSTHYDIENDYWTLTPVSNCPEGESPNENGVCRPTPCDSSDLLADCDGDGTPNGKDPDNDEDGDGTPDKCDSDSSNYANYDCDGDGDPNGTDPAPNDPLTSTGDSTDCTGKDNSNYVYYPSSPIYSMGDYSYKPYAYSESSCRNYISNSIDSVLTFVDINPACEREYCFAHSVSNCLFSASDRVPSGYIYKSSANTENACQAFVDGIKYSSMIWDVPNSLSCPTVAFCFLKPIIEPDGDSNSENDDDSMDEVDLNTTSQDNQALLQSQNTTNKHLKDLKDKTDLTNDKLDSLSDINNQILTANKDNGNKLDNLKNDTSKLVSNSDLMNTSLSNMNKSILNLNSNTKSLHTDLLNANTELDNITNNTNAINSNLIDLKDSVHDALFTDSNPFENDLDDGLIVGDIDTTVKNSLSSFVQSNIFTFSSASYTVPTISFNSSLGSFTIFSPNTLSAIDINSIRFIFLFFFAVAGFITVFKTI